MTYAVALIALYGLTAGATVASIGKHREPITPGVALVSLIVSGLAIWAIVALSNAAC